MIGKAVTKWGIHESRVIAVEQYFFRCLKFCRVRHSDSSKNGVLLRGRTGFDENGFVSNGVEGREGGWRRGAMAE